MTRYMPITGIDCTIPSLLIDTEAPGGDAALLQEFARVLAIPLRDGCDLLDVFGRRLRAQL